MTAHIASLAAAQHNEYEEYDDVYKTFGDVAEREGFIQIAQTFRNIASIQKNSTETDSDIMRSL